MDPNEALRRALNLAKTILAEVEDSSSEYPPEAMELAELMCSLDEWISKGGFLPTSWGRK